MPTLTYLLYFPQWWYINRTQWWFVFISRTLLLNVDRTAIGPQLKSLFSPYHNDKTAVGIGMGFVLRSASILYGFSLLAILFAVLTMLYVGWFLWPLGVFWGIRTGGMMVVVGFIATFSALVFYWLRYVLQPKFTLQQLFEQDDDSALPSLPKGVELREYSTGPARKVLRNLPQSFSSGSLMRMLAVDLEIIRLFRRMELTDEQIVTRLSQQSSKQSQVITQDDLAEAAINHALKHRHRHITTSDLFLGLVNVSPVMSQILSDLGIKKDELEQAAAWVESESQQKDSWRWWMDEFFHRTGGVDRGWTSGWTPTMKHFSTDITAEVAAGHTPYIVGRDNEIEQVVRILERATKNNVLLIGEPGVGKSSIVDGIAQEILRAEVSPGLAESRVIQLDLPSVLSAAKSPDDVGKMLTKALTELTAGKTVLFIDAIENLVRRDGVGTIDVKAVLTPFIESGSLKVIGSTTLAAYHRHIESDPGFMQHFQSVAIEEPEAQEAEAILQGYVAAIEQRQGIQVSIPAIAAAVDLSQRYIQDRVLPEKAIDLLDEVAAYSAQQKKATTTAEDVAVVVSQKTGIPVASITQDEAEKLMNLEQILHQKIIGQSEAVNAVADALRRSRAGLKDDKRPMAVFMFVGPTGTGKTALAKTIAESYFGSEEAMIRLDMSEYQTPDSINKIIGSPPGSVGFEEGGLLTTAVRSNPFTVILLDELEKAHPRIIDVFLQVFDDGRLTDSMGRTASFSNCVIIATSNAGSRPIQSAIKQGYTPKQIVPAVKELLAQQYFRPEFLNRFDDIVVFKQLELSETIQITKLMLDEIARKIADKNIELTFSEGLIQKIAEAGFDPVYGARPLRHMIQDKVENALAKQILAGQIKPGAVVELNEQNTQL